MKDFFEFLEVNDSLGVLFFFGLFFSGVCLVGVLVALVVLGYGLAVFGLLVCAMLVIPAGAYFWSKHND